MYLSDGTINPPLGVRGGGPGATARQATRGRDGVACARPTCVPACDLRPGTTLLSRCCGGGGYGDPLEREPARVAKDVSERSSATNGPLRATESCWTRKRGRSSRDGMQRAALRSNKEAAATTN